jgi:hypothetical protein
MRLPDNKTCDQAWQIAGKVEWDGDDWQTFYEYLTRAFIIIAAKHAKARIESAQSEGAAT